MVFCILAMMCWGKLKMALSVLRICISMAFRAMRGLLTGGWEVVGIWHFLDIHEPVKSI